MKQIFSSACILAALALSAPATAQTYSWAQMPTPNPSPERNLLRGISGTSPTDVWAVGDFQTSPPGLVQYTQDPLIIHWDGTSWTTYPVQTFSNSSSFWDVEAIAPDNVWAVGDYGPAATSQIAHWDGSSWTNEAVIMSVPGSWPTTNYLWSIDAVSASDIWAVGGKAGVNINPCFAYHYDGSTWTDVPVPTVGLRRNRFTAVDGIAGNDVWAVGSYGDVAGEFRHLAMHWNGSTWTNHPLPASITAIRGELLNVKMVSSNDVWAVGDLVTGGMVTVHWDGTSWTEVPTNGAGGGGDFAILGPNDIYAVGSRIGHWDGSTWSLVDTLGTLPYPSLIAATTLPNGEVWAAGRTIDFNDKFYTLIYRYSAANPQLTVTTSAPVVPAGASVQLQAQPTVPGNYTYRWSAIGGNAVFSDSTAANPTVTPSGTTTYAVNMRNADGTSLQGWVKVQVSGMVAAEEQVPEAALAAWPNPFSDKVQVSFTSAQNQEAEVTLTNTVGSTVSQTKMQLKQGPNELQLQVSAPGTGLYLLQIRTAEAVWQQKLIRQ